MSSLFLARVAGRPECSATVCPEAGDLTPLRQGVSGMASTTLGSPVASPELGRRGDRAVINGGSNDVAGAAFMPTAGETAMRVTTASTADADRCVGLGRVVLVCPRLAPSYSQSRGGRTGVAWVLDGGWRRRRLRFR